MKQLSTNGLFTRTNSIRLPIRYYLAMVKQVRKWCRYKRGEQEVQIMMHTKRIWCVIEIKSAEELARLLTLSKPLAAVKRFQFKAIRNTSG